MFVLKSIGQLLSSAAPSTGKATDLVQLPSGKAFSKQKGQAKWQLSFPGEGESGMLTIRRTSMEFQYLLVLSPASAATADELDAEDEEKQFLIDPAIRFHKSTAGGGCTMKWTDPATQTAYEFRMDGKAANKHTVDFFETTLLECMFERVYQKSRDLASIDDLESLRHVEAPGVQATEPGTEDEENTSTNVTNAEQEPPAAVVGGAVGEGGKPLISTVAELFLYDPSTGQFILQQKEAHAKILQTSLFRFLLVVGTKEQAILSQPVENNMNPIFNTEFHSFIWVYHDETNQLSYSWSLRFTDANQETEFREMFAQCMYETLNREPFNKVKTEDQQFLVDAYAEDVEMEDAFAEEDKENQSAEEEEEEDETEDRPAIHMGRDNEDQKNSQLAVGFKNHRSFVVRGNRIGVFKHGDENLEFATSINNISTPTGDVFAPGKVMLHDQDASMIMFNPDQPNNLYHMDLERGQIVDEWKVDEYRNIIDFTHDSKYAQMTPQKTFVGVSNNAIFRIDPRQAGNKIVDSQVNQYKSKNAFSCAATTGTGELVVASDKGDVRLYNHLEKRAKTHLPGLGEPVIGIDVSVDGKYILSTCKTYILVISAEAKGEDGQMLSGFHKSLGAKKPAPKRLQLKPEHVSWINEPINFTPARFNTGEDMEKTIVTTTGPYVITWNFRRVKAGRLYDYTIKKYPTSVVASNFGYGNDSQVIVALPDDVTMVSKKQFVAPAKAFGSPVAPKTPVRNLRSRDAIVNSPF